MTSQALQFSPALVASPPTPEVPTAKQVLGMALLGLDMRLSGRTVLMNQIGNALSMPPGGWTHGQSKLFEGGDIRLLALLRRMTHKRTAVHVADNLKRAAQFSPGALMLALVTAAREHGSAPMAGSAARIESFNDGGLDFLWEEKAHLGLPHYVTKAWSEVLPRDISAETGNEVHAAWIPARDQMLVYAAQLRAGFELHFSRNLKAELGAKASTELASASRLVLMIWRAYAFLAPGGEPYHPEKAFSAQNNQHFGCRSALGYLSARAGQSGAPSVLELVLKDATLDQSAWVRSAKTRVAEAMFLETLLARVRELLPA